MPYLVKLSSAPWYWSNAKYGFVERDKATEYKTKLVASLAAAKTPGAVVVGDK